MTISRRIIIMIRLALIGVFFFNLYGDILEPTIAYTFILATYAGITAFSLFPDKPDRPSDLKEDSFTKAQDGEIDNELGNVDPAKNAPWLINFETQKLKE